MTPVSLTLIGIGGAYLTYIILAPTNNVVNQVNERCLKQLPGDPVVIPSINRTVNPDEAIHYTPEYIGTLEDSGVPPHKLSLKKGAVVILLRNLNVDRGLCNGTRMIANDVINKRLLKAVIAVGEHKGYVLIAKVPTKPADSKLFVFEWERLQFPIKLAFAMTANKAQGQTLENVSVWLENPCFGHGQLYVAASRVGNGDNIKFYISNKEGYPKYTTRNIVYHELLEE